MPKLSIDEIRKHAAKAGFQGQDLNIAVAVALAESGGDPKSHNATPPDDSYGLWQINMLGDMGPERRKRFGIMSNSELYDPDVNARAAYSIYQSQGWEKGWTTYKNGKYKSFLPAHVNTDTALDEVKDPIANTINNFGETVFKAGSNLVGAMIAISLLSVGIAFLIMSSKSARKAASIAANVLPGGKAVKAGFKEVVKK